MQQYAFPDLYEFVSKSGIAIPDTSTLKTRVEQMMYTIFGVDLDVTAETPMGRLIEAITMLMAQTLGVNAQNANQLNIYQSTGAYLDAIGSLFGVVRKGATRTRVKIKVAGTCDVVPQNSLIKTTNGDEFYVEEDIELQNGTGEGYALSSETGAIPCDYGTLTDIQSQVIGWESVTNMATSPVYGTSIETDAAFRERIIAARSTGSASVEAIANAIYSCDDQVSSCFVLENGYSQPIVKRGVTLPAHTIYACVSGGNEDAIAQAIFRTKTAGAGYVQSAGTATKKTKTITDSLSGQTYSIVFFRPIERTVSFSVSVVRNSYGGTGIVADLRRLLQDYANECGIGGTISTSGAVAYIATKIPSIEITGITMEIDGTEYTSFNFDGNKMPVTSDASITINEV